MAYLKQELKKLQELWENEREDLMYFIPCSFFVAIGLLIFMVPEWIFHLLALSFMFVGCCLAFFVSKFIKLKKRIENTVNSIQGRVLIQGLDVSDPFESEAEEPEEKKIILH